MFHLVRETTSVSAQCSLRFGSSLTFTPYSHILQMGHTKVEEVGDFELEEMIHENFLTIAEFTSPSVK